MSAAQIVVVLWIAFYGYWMFAARGVKKNVRNEGRFERNVIRIGLIAAIFLIFRIPSVVRGLEHYRRTYTGPATETIGFLLCLAGFAFAIWARLHLGRNWGQPMTLKAGHELITTGPYRYIRHPIYTGILIAMLGSTLVTPFWVVAFIFLTGYFVYSARTEERIMTQQFPDQYPAYRKKTGALVPFL